MQNNKKIIILIVLSIIAVFSIMRNLRAPSEAGYDIAPDGGRLTDMAKSISAPVRSAKRTDFDSWKRSPFVPKDVSVKVAPKLTLSGIFWDDVKPAAIIGDEVVNIGSRIGDIVVIDIKKGSVLLSDGIDNFELTLEEE